MNNYLIGYDLMRQGQNYENLYEGIKKASNGNWWHHLDSTWIIQSEHSALTIRNYLLDYIDSNDKIIVLQLSKDGAWFNISDEGNKWLYNNLL